MLLTYIFKFQVWVVHSKGDIHVQKIKVQNILFEYICHSFRGMIVYFPKLYIIRKASNQFETL